MPRVKKPVPTVLAKRAATLRARRELDEIEEMRFVKEAVVTSGLSQEVVAEAMGVSQPTIHRIVKKISDNPKVLKPSVEEIINRATVKEISRPEMLQALRGLKIGYTKWEKRPDSDWARLRNALHHGLVTETEAHTIAEETARKMVERVAHSMDLEAQQVPQTEVDKMVRETTAKLVADLG